MQYRSFGRTGIEVSALGFGVMRVPMRDGRVDEEATTPILRKALDLGVNYFDSAWGYCNGTSEGALGKAIKGWPRGKVYLSTKAPVQEKEHVLIWRERLENQLRRLEVNYIDIYHCHNLKWDEFRAFVAPPGGVLEQARRAQAEGLIRHLSFSCHDTPENMRRLVDTGEFASVTLQYNLLERVNEPVIAHAWARGVGVTVMGPVGGGRLALPSNVIQGMLPTIARSTPEIAIRFVLANPAVGVAISGMNTVRMVEENAATASRVEPLTPGELAQIEDALTETERLSDLYCTGCDYCAPCPNGVRISENFRLMNYHRVYGLTEYARQRYSELAGDDSSAESCLECGECEPKCPQRIEIAKQLRETAKVLGR